MSDDHVVTRIEILMIVDGEPVGAVFSRPEKIAELLTTPQSLGEWLRLLRDAPAVPEIDNN
ncbi:MAG TPA: hypothetical protein VLE97_06210 [Gaiellaceae bacterium]|nr:hypothetical protein [Gaiellaceae bacterium]